MIFFDTQTKGCYSKPNNCTRLNLNHHLLSISIFLFGKGGNDSLIVVIL
jgi:hypothetical protein